MKLPSYAMGGISVTVTKVTPSLYYYMKEAMRKTVGEFTWEL